MKKEILIITTIFIILAAGCFLFFSAKPVNHKNTELLFDLNNDVQIEIRDMNQVPKEYYSGNSRYSKGECQIDNDCSITGCSSEMCTADSSIMTTCEILTNAPDKNKYACGCIKDRCGWYLLH